MLFRGGDKGVPDGREIQFQMLNPFAGHWSKRDLERAFEVFGDERSFLLHYNDAAPLNGKLSSADFEDSYLVAIHQGLCPTGGYSVRVSSVRRQRGVVTITVDFQEPGPNDIVTMAMTTPRVFLALPRPQGSLCPLFRFRSPEGTLLAERRPVHGEAGPSEGM